MGKKRLFTLDKKAQITIFMITGILLFFAFLFVMYLASSVELSQLSSEQEKIITKAFKKESFRLFVDDCLQDELKSGLILLGRQGTLWADQPGGTKQFSEGINGITYGQDRVFYSIANEYYPSFPSAYPCNEEANFPAFCRYRYPSTTAGFGTLKLFPSTFSDDLQQYLLNRTAWCVQSFILTNVSQHAEIISTDIDLQLAVGEEGISVKVNYPLKFKVGREEIFQLSTFDFFYPSHFNQLLSVISKHLEWDKQLVDFNYTESTFTQPTFSYASENNVGPCTSEGNYFQCSRALPSDMYRSLGITLHQENIGGDDLFTFTPALYEIVDAPEPYIFQVARQNRPPALEFIERAGCPAEGYDYLVIKNHADYGNINLAPHAIDADEDGFVFSYTSSRFGEHEDLYILSAEEVASANIPNGIYTITTAATDDHGEKDSQDVRILVDRPIEVGLALEFPPSYSLQSFIGGGDGTIPLYVVSKEDPILLHATIPAGTVTSNLQTFVLNYVDGALVNNIARLEYGNPYLSTEQCYHFPLQREEDASTCLPGVPYDLDSYYGTNEKINRIAEQNYYGFHPFQKITPLASPGTLTLNFNTNYCGLPLGEQQSRINVLVAECVPHRNPAHPFAYHPTENYQNYKFGLNADGTTNFNAFQELEEINPFEATHSCCIGTAADPDDWRLATAADDPCFVNPEPGCYGGLLGYTSGTNKGYVLEEEKVFCDGLRGNMCNGPHQWQLYGEEMRCGVNGQNECSGIHDACEGQLAFSFIDSGWCSGKMGCANICTSAVVYRGAEDRTYFTSENINQMAIEAEGDLTIFACGCTNADNGNRCDADFDGRFEGRCSGGDCTE